MNSHSFSAALLTKKENAHSSSLMRCAVNKHATHVRTVLLVTFAYLAFAGADRFQCIVVWSIHLSRTVVWKHCPMNCYSWSSVIWARLILSKHSTGSTIDSISWSANRLVTSPFPRPLRSQVSTITQRGFEMLSKHLTSIRKALFLHALSHASVLLCCAVRISPPLLCLSIVILHSMRFIRVCIPYESALFSLLTGTTNTGLVLANMVPNLEKMRMCALARILDKLSCPAIVRLSLCSCSEHALLSLCSLTPNLVSLNIKQLVCTDDGAHLHSIVALLPQSTRLQHLHITSTTHRLNDIRWIDKLIDFYQSSLEHLTLEISLNNPVDGYSLQTRLERCRRLSKVTFAFSCCLKETDTIDVLRSFQSDWWLDPHRPPVLIFCSNHCETWIVSMPYHLDGYLWFPIDPEDWLMNKGRLDSADVAFVKQKMSSIH